jgi:hypothetical protein
MAKTRRSRANSRPQTSRGAATPAAAVHHAQSQIKIGSNDHQFGRSRYNQHKLSFTNPPSKSGGGFQKLPPPPGKAPYRLDLKDVVDGPTYDAIVAANHLVFHASGDTGGVKDPHPQEYVAYAMEEDFYHDPADPSVNPAFFYQLGDCVYFNGESSQYYSQFYDPYEHYLAPIFAVPGNHDGRGRTPPTRATACAPR